MGVFNPAVITAKGQALLAKTVAGTCKMQFTRMALSDVVPLGSLSSVNELESIKQEEYISYLGIKGDTSVMCEVAFTNANLAKGYCIKTIGIYANDPDDGEILYCISTADETKVTADWMPPFTGKGVTSLLIDVITTVANSSNVSISIDSNAYATKGELEDLKNSLGEHTHLIAGTPLAGEYVERVYDLVMVTAIHPDAHMTYSGTSNSYTCEGNGYLDIGVCSSVNADITPLVTDKEVFVEIEGHGTDSCPSIDLISVYGLPYMNVFTADLTQSADKSFHFKWSGIVSNKIRVSLSAGSMTFTSFKIAEVKGADGFMSVADKRKLDSIPEGGVSVDLTDYVKNTDYATNDKHGLIKGDTALGIRINTLGAVYIDRATEAQIDAKADKFKPIVPANLEYAVKSVGDGYYATETEVGKIDTALDRIIAIQESFFTGSLM